MPICAENRALIRRLEVTSRRLLAGVLAGEYRTHFRGRGMEFAELRPYQPGDEVRHLDWHVTARTGTPHVRTYREERSRTLLLLADLSPSCAGGKRDLLLQAAGLLAFAAVQSRDRLALAAFTDRTEHLVPPGTGRNHARRILLDLLTLAPGGRKTDLAPPLQAALDLARRPGMAILLSDFHAPLPEALLRRVGSRHDLAALVLRDPREQDLPAGGLTALNDAESAEVRLVDLGSRRARRALAEGWTRIDRALAGRLHRLGIDHAFLHCGRPLLPPLLAFFRQRQRRR